MADSKISGLPQMPELALEDQLLFIDKSDATMGLNGSNKVGDLNQLGLFLKQFNNSAVENNYLTVAAMLAGQANQTAGNFQYVQDASADPNVFSGVGYYEYLGSGTGVLSNYRLLNAQESQAVQNEVINKFKVAQISNSALVNAGNGGISFYYNGTTNFVKEIIFNNLFSKYLVAFKDVQLTKKYYLKLFNTTQKKTVIFEVRSLEFTDASNNFIKIYVVEDQVQSFAVSDVVLVGLSVSSLDSTQGLNAPQVVNYKVYGAVPTNYSATNILDIVNFLNEKHLTAIPNKLMVLLFLVKRTVNGQVNYVKSIYFFKRNNIPGTYGTNQTNGLVTAEDLIFVNETQVNQVTNDSDTIVIDLGDIGTGTIAGYLSANPQPTSGQNWNLLANKSYFFTYTSNGKAITDFYVGPKPVQLGNQESPIHIVLNEHLQRISTDGENEDIYALKSVVYPKQTTNTGTVIDLGYVAGNQCNKASANATTTYTTTNLKLNGNATIRINAANEPTITGATKLAGSDFQANTNMDLCVQYDGANVEYFFVKL